MQAEYIDDVAITVEGKTAEENSQTLMKITKTTFQWADENAVTFRKEIQQQQQQLLCQTTLLFNLLRLYAD